MAAANTDKFKKTKARFSTTLSGSISDSDTTIACSDLSGVPTDTAVNFVINRVDANGDKTGSGDWETVTGVVSGNNITNAVRGVEGTAQAHSASAVVEILWTADNFNDAVDGVLVEHAQDGTHTDITADTIIVADGGSIEVDTVNEATAANGVTVDGLNIKDSKLVTADSVVAANITDGIIENAHLNTTAGELGGAWQTYSPSWTDLTVGNGTESHRYMQIGKTVIVQGSFEAGSTSSSTLSVNLTLPVTASSNYATYDLLGHASYLDSNLTDFYYGPILYGSTSDVIFQSIYVYNTGEDAQTLNTDMDATARPFQMATGDRISWTITYEAA